ncbi:ECF transporter S component [Clostridium sporogenes]|uniref:ECF transporter S component n=1 Tax=Clostridium sp. LCP25S3_F8 TaxID=3438751 RepID=UPI0013D13B38|nr:ECF transporter S component [Clostridium sporogenes]NFS25578.1 ECF transporter S component [Clostridium sporogenes]
MKKEIQVKTMVLCGLFIAAAIILRFFSIMVPIAGAGAMRISFAGIFIKMPALLFGGAIGGIVSGVVDILAYIIKPMGAYIPLLTLTSILSGILTGIIWTKVKNIHIDKIEKCYPIFFMILGLLAGAIHLMVMLSDKAFSFKIMNILGKKYIYVLSAIEIITIFALIVFIINIRLKNNKTIKHIYEVYMKMILAIGIPGIIVCTINTFILLMFIPALRGNSFMFLWIPRITEEVFMIVFESYAVSLLLRVYESVVLKISNQ